MRSAALEPRKAIGAGTPPRARVGHLVGPCACDVPKSGSQRSPQCACPARSNDRSPTDLGRRPMFRWGRPPLLRPAGEQDRGMRRLVRLAGGHVGGTFSLFAWAGAHPSGGWSRELDRDVASGRGGQPMVPRGSVGSSGGTPSWDLAWDVPCGSRPLMGGLPSAAVPGGQFPSRPTTCGDAIHLPLIDESK